MTTPQQSHPDLIPSERSLIRDQFYTNFDIAYERINAEPITDINIGIVGLLDPLRAPYDVLPFLAELYYADTWSPLLSEEYQRNAIQSSWYFWQFRSTKACLDRFAENLNVTYTLTVERDTTSEEYLALNPRIDPIPLVNVSILMTRPPTVSFTVDIAEWLGETVCRLLPFGINRCRVSFAQTYRAEVTPVVGLSTYHIHYFHR